jgi:hypothetical protein
VEKETSSSSGTKQSGVRRQWLLQIGGRAGENERGKMGRGRSGVPRSGGRKRERGVGGGVAWGQQPDYGTPSGMVGGGSARSRRRRAGERGWAAGPGVCGVVQEGEG